MKQGSIKEAQTRRKKDAVYSVVLFAVLQMLCAAVLIGLCFLPDIPKGVVAVLLVMAGLDLLLIWPTIRLLKERFREIEGGELDAAGQY